MARPPQTRKQDTPLRRALQVSRALRAQTTPKSLERMAARVCKLENPLNPSGSQYQSPGKHTTPEASSPEPVLLYHRATQHSKAQTGFASPTPPTWKDLPNSAHCLLQASLEALHTAPTNYRSPVLPEAPAKHHRWVLLAPCETPGG